MNGQQTMMKPTKETLALARKIVLTIQGQPIGRIAHAFSLIVGANNARHQKAIDKATSDFDAPGVPLGLIDDLPDSLADAPADSVRKEAAEVPN